jgi:hypothetical protein
MTRLAEFSSADITVTSVGRKEQGGEVLRLARGLYQLPDGALDARQALACWPMEPYVMALTSDA